MHDFDQAVAALKAAGDDTGQLASHRVEALKFEGEPWEVVQSWAQEWPLITHNNALTPAEALREAITGAKFLDGVPGEDRQKLRGGRDRAGNSKSGE